MGILSRVTKVLFGLQDRREGESDADIEIRDGRIIAIDGSDSTNTPEDDPDYVFEGERPSEGLKSPKKARPDIKGQGPKEDSQEKGKDGHINAFSVSEEERGFFEWLTVGNRAERTKQEYVWEIRWWQKKAKWRKKTLLELTVNDIESALRRVRPQAAIRKIAALKTWARWQLREGNGSLFLEIEKVIRPKKPKSLPKDLGPKRFRELKRQAKELVSQGRREGIWIGLMLCGGLRISEIKTCQPYQDGVKVVGKGSKERYVPLPSWLLEGMKNIRRKRPNGWAVSRKTITVHLNKMGLRKVHSLRHTYASELVRRGYKIEEIQKLLGHENIQTTTVYARIDVPSDVVERLEL